MLVGEGVEVQVRAAAYVEHDAADQGSEVGGAVGPRRALRRGRALHRLGDAGPEGVGVERPRLALVALGVGALRAAAAAVGTTLAVDATIGATATGLGVGVAALVLVGGALRRLERRRGIGVVVTLIADGAELALQGQVAQRRADGARRLAGEADLATGTGGDLGVQVGQDQPLQVVGQRLADLALWPLDEDGVALA